MIFGSAVSVPLAQRIGAQPIGGEGALGAVVDAEVEQFAGVGIALGMGREGLHLAAEILHAVRQERAGIEGVGRAAFP